MTRIENSVFISYRRTNLPWALAVYQYLMFHDYDVFFDYQSIKGGDFEQVITENIEGRAHFIIILTPSALERCNEPNDWLRREIEIALEKKRNIIPLMLEGFSFSSPAIAEYLTGKLGLLKKYNGLNVPVDYFEEAMLRLRKDRLDVSLDTIRHPISDNVQERVKQQQLNANKATKIQKNELSSQKWVEKGNQEYFSYAFQDSIKSHSEAIKLNPDFAEAYVGRGRAYWKVGDMDKAISDYDEALKLRNDFPDAYNYRGLALHLKGDRNSAIKDLSEAIKLRPDYGHAYNGRGLVRTAQGDLEGAMKDFNLAIQYNIVGQEYLPYHNRGWVYKLKGNLDDAINDYTKAIHLNPKYADTYFNRALVWEKKRDYTSAVADFQKYLELGGGTREGEAKDKIKRLKSKLARKKSSTKKSK